MSCIRGQTLIISSLVTSPLCHYKIGSLLVSSGVEPGGAKQILGGRAGPCPLLPTPLSVLYSPFRSQGTLRIKLNA